MMTIIIIIKIVILIPNSGIKKAITKLYAYPKVINSYQLQFFLPPEHVSSY